METPALGVTPTIPDISLNNVLNEATPIGELKDQLNEVSEIKSSMEDYKSDLKNIPETIEGKVADMQQVKDLQSEISQLEPISTDYNDPDKLRELALRSAKQQAINHFAGHEKQLQDLMNQLSKKKSALKGTDCVIDLFKKENNPMRNKTIMQLLVPGLTFQAQYRSVVFLDINPSINFLISNRWSAGLGWNERIAYDFKQWSFQNQYRIFGPRVMVLFKLKQHFNLIASYEIMQTESVVGGLRTDEKGKWITSYFAGVKRDFKLSSRFQGHIQVLYNLYDPEKTAPYQSRVNLRFGIELRPPKKPIKKLV